MKGFFKRIFSSKAKEDKPSAMTHKRRMEMDSQVAKLIEEFNYNHQFGAFYFSIGNDENYKTYVNTSASCSKYHIIHAISHICDTHPDFRSAIIAAIEKHIES